ncbi:molybdate ABC transporter substrate-binding protein [Colwellia sp. E2M01]|nr:molybdate ABC transporter substrate-binding protein [Colwellia sp. E2M01]
MLRLLSVIYSFSLFSVILINNQSAQANENNVANINNNTPLRVAVAANFTLVLNALLEDFNKQTGITTQVISGASGALFLQIKHGAPFDVFLSADSRRPQALEQAKLTVKNSRETYAIGQLAYYSSSTKNTSISTSNPTESSAKSSIANNTVLSKQQLQDVLTAAAASRFAIANPDIAPYGKAAKETLISLGLWQAYQPQLITGVNIGQTFSQIRTKAVSQGLVANSQLILNDLSGFIISSDLHQPIEQQLVIIRASKQQAKAQKLKDFLLSTATQENIVSYGYAAPEKISRDIQSELISQ